MHFHGCYSLYLSSHRSPSLQKFKDQILQDSYGPNLPEGKLEREKFLWWPTAPDTAVDLRVQLDLTHPFSPTQSILNLPALPYHLSMFWLLIRWRITPHPPSSWGSECLMTILSLELSCYGYLVNGPREYREPVPTGKRGFHVFLPPSLCKSSPTFSCH